MAKELKIWNGRPYGVLPPSQWKDSHIFVAAFSIVDARRVCVEVGGSDPGYSEIKNYWSSGCWGNAMEGIPIERGVWVQYGRETPIKLCGANPRSSAE